MISCLMSEACGLNYCCNLLNCTRTSITTASPGGCGHRVTAKSCQENTNFLDYNVQSSHKIALASTNMRVVRTTIQKNCMGLV